MLSDAWLKMVGVLTPDDMKLLKDRGFDSESYDLLKVLEKLILAWQETEPGPMDKKEWADIQKRLAELREALH